MPKKAAILGQQPLSVQIWILLLFCFSFVTSKFINSVFFSLSDRALRRQLKSPLNFIEPVTIFSQEIVYFFLFFLFVFFSLNTPSFPSIFRPCMHPSSSKSCFSHFSSKCGAAAAAAAGLQLTNWLILSG